MAADQLRHDGELAARDLHPGELGPAFEAAGDLLECAAVDALDRDVVEHGDRLGADADDVVDIHRDAVDADAVEPPELLGEDQLRADAVGAQRDPKTRRDLDNGGVMAAGQHRA